MSQSTTESWRPAPASFRLVLPTATNGSVGATLPMVNTLPSWWSGVGGPALIVVFVAVGLLAAIIAVLMILHATRVLPVNGPVTVTRLRKKKLGEKPKLYDLPLAYGEGGFKGGSTTGWDGIMVSTIFG